MPHSEEVTLFSLSMQENRISYHLTKSEGASAPRTSAMPGHGIAVASREFLLDSSGEENPTNTGDKATLYHLSCVE